MRLILSPTKQTRGITRFSQTLGDLLHDVVLELSSRRMKAIMMICAVGLSTGALQTSMGLAHQATHQISADISATTLNMIYVSAVPGTQGANQETFPHDTEELLNRIEMVESAGRQLEVTESTSISVTRVHGVPNDTSALSTPIRVTGVFPETLAAYGVDFPAEHSFWLEQDFPVAFVGSSAAEELGISKTGPYPGVKVWIEGQPFDVISVLDTQVETISHAVLIPYDSALAMTQTDADTFAVVKAAPGSGAQLSKLLASAIRPDAPERLESSGVESLNSLERGVSTQMDKLAAWMGLTMMTLTILLIANSMAVSVMSRTGEIGLRRALGFSRRMVAGVFLFEGMVIGFLGGLVGSAVSTTATVAIAAANGWTAILNPVSTLSGPLLGTLVGLVASVYPALRASQVSPALAVRSE